MAGRAEKSKDFGLKPLFHCRPDSLNITFDFFNFKDPFLTSNVEREGRNNRRHQRREKWMKTPRSHIYPSLPGTEEMLHLDVLLEGRGASSMPWALRGQAYPARSQVES
nr:uncharacterized protein LOC123281782 isoform X7 [Equus asinus]